MTLILLLTSTARLYSEEPTRHVPLKNAQPKVPQMLLAGAAAVEISPKHFPVNMPGGFAENFATKSHDPLHARAVVLSDSKLTLALVLLDNLGAAQEVIDEIKFLATRRCDLLPEHILISSTHTHSAPASNVKEGPAEAVAYRKILIDGTVEAIVSAHKALRPATVGVGVHPLPDEVFNRRWFLKPGNVQLYPFGGVDLVRMNPGTSPDVLSHPAGPTDPDVTVLSLNEANGNRPLAVYANYSLHYVGGTPKAEVSADYFGEFARLIPYRVGSPPGFVAMMTNGTSGDINNIPFGVTPPRPPRETFEQIRIVASKAADAVWQARQKINTHRGDVTLDMIQRELKLRHRKPTSEQLERATQIVKLESKEEKDKLPRLAEDYAQRTIRQAQVADTITVPLQAVRIGDFVICAIPFETFVEIGLDLKKRSPFPRTMVVSIANGYNGYLPTPEHHKLGGYETWLGTNRVQEDASVLITNTMLEMVKELSTRSRN
jgi:hypothetical protein